MALFLPKISRKIVQHCLSSSGFSSDVLGTCSCPEPCPPNACAECCFGCDNFTQQGSFISTLVSRGSFAAFTPTSPNPAINNVSHPDGTPFSFNQTATVTGNVVGGDCFPGAFEVRASTNHQFGIFAPGGPGTVCWPIAGKFCRTRLDLSISATAAGSCAPTFSSGGAPIPMSLVFSYVNGYGIGSAASPGNFSTSPTCTGLVSVFNETVTGPFGPGTINFNRTFYILGPIFFNCTVSVFYGRWDSGAALTASYTAQATLSVDNTCACRP